MKAPTKNRTVLRRRRQRGVALIITLGLLAVLTILAVAFAIAMRVESIAARNFRDMVRAKHLVQTALTESLDDVSRACAGKTYPDFYPYSGVHDAIGSPPGSTNVNLVVGEAERAIPGILRADARAVSSYWMDVLVTNYTDTGTAITQTNGRIAYVVVNCSGLLDANRIGGTERELSTDVGEIDVSYVIPDELLFLTERTNHVRYETVQELRAINDAVGTYAMSNLFVNSFDPGPDVYMADTNQLGSLDALLLPKFNINSITNYACYYNMTDPAAFRTDAAFMAGYFGPLKTILMAALPDMPTNKANDVTWNVVNYLDKNRIPNGPNPYQWRHTESGENTPLINEIYFEEFPSGSTNYRFRVEVWYPFIPTNVVSEDGFKLEIGVFSNNWEGATAPNEMDIMDHAWLHYVHDIDDMQFGSSTEFLVFDTESFAPPKYPDKPIANTNAVWFLSRVLKVDTPSGGGTPITNVVDEAMGYQKSEEEDGTTHRRALKKFIAPVDYQINDPRTNGQCRYWDPTLPDSGYPGDCRIGRKYSVAAHTLGALNDPSYFTYFGTPKSQGIPIWYEGRTMRNISEIGHVFRSNMDDEVASAHINYGYWRNIDLMNRDEGAALIDWLTVRENNRSCRGRVTINTRQKPTLHSLIHDLQPGDPSWGDYMGTLTPVMFNRITNVVHAIQTRARALEGCKHWRDLFDAGSNPADPTEPADDGGPVADALRACVDGILASGIPTNDILKEAVCRSVVELLSFRQIGRAHV